MHLVLCNSIYIYILYIYVYIYIYISGPVSPLDNKNSILKKYLDKSKVVEEKSVIGWMIIYCYLTKTKVDCISIAMIPSTWLEILYKGFGGFDVTKVSVKNSNVSTALLP